MLLLKILFYIINFVSDGLVKLSKKICLQTDIGIALGSRLNSDIIFLATNFYLDICI